MNKVKENVKAVMTKTVGRVFHKGMEKEEGIDGILVTVGLCIIALVLCGCTKAVI